MKMKISISNLILYGGVYGPGILFTKNRTFTITLQTYNKRTFMFRGYSQKLS